jgi:uncharacterized membrane protein
MPRYRSARAVRRGLRADFRSGLLTGGGMGAFIDGILLHQVLQWHNLLSSVRPPVDLLSMKYNMLYDGLFHAGAWVLTAVGVSRLLGLAQRGEVVSAGRFGGGVVAGWGLFNVLEGLLDHQLFGLHHVHPGAHELAWDWGFVAASAALVGIGFGLAAHSNSH